MFLKVSLLAVVAIGAFGQQAAAPAPAARGPRVAPTFPPLFIAEDWTRPANARGQVPVTASNVSHQNLELKVYGTDAKNLTISGEAGNATGPLNLWTGMCTAPVAATLRDKNNYVDLTGLAKVRWVTRASGFHVVRPVVKLADGTMLVGDHVDASTTTFLGERVCFHGTALDQAGSGARGDDRGLRAGGRGIVVGGESGFE